MKTLLRTALITLIALTISSIANAASTFTLNGLFTFGPRGDGSVQPVANPPANVLSDSIGFSPYTGYEVRITSLGTTNAWFPNEGLIDARTGGSTNGFNMRGLTYDPVSGNVLLVDTHSGTGGSNTISPFTGIYVLDANTGLIKGGLKTNGIAVGAYVIVPVGVADDGVVYIANQTTASQTTGFKIYRWPSADTNNPGFTANPTVCFSNLIGASFGTSGERIGQSMDVRGSGTNTLIIVGVSGSQAGTTMTNVFLFDTADGTNFACHRIAIPGITTSLFNDGIAFGPGNTFWAKQVGKPLVYISWDDGARATGTNQIPGAIISSFTASSANDPLLNIGPITYDPVNKLLGGLEEIGGIATGGRGKVWLFHIPDPTNHAPSVLASRTYAPNFQKALAPMGYLHFGSSGTRLYANVVNNGMLASTVDSVTLNPPTFTQDLPSTTRVAVGTTAHFEVFAVQDVTNYQWYSNNVPVTGANTYYIDVPTTTTNQTGISYKVIAFNAAGSTESVHSTLTVVSASQFFHPQLLWSKQANGTALTDGTNFITSTGGGGTPNERTIAYDAGNNRLVVVRGPGTFSNLKIFVLDAHSGNFLWLLPTNGITPSATLTLCGVGIADDGAVYASSVGGAGGSDPSFKVYRWENTESTAMPVVIFGTNSSAMSGNPYADLLGSQYLRTGDSLAVRGGGTSTEILVDSQNATPSSAFCAAILTPTDGTMTNWTQKGHQLQNILGSYGSAAYGTTIGRSLLFGSGNTFWQKRYNGPNNGTPGAPFTEMGYTPNVGNDVIPLILANVSASLLTNGPTAIHPVLKVGASVTFVPGINADNASAADTLNYFDLTDPSQAVLLFSDTLPGGNVGFHKMNNNGIAQVLFGSGNDNGTNYLFVLNGNNGVSAYALVGGTVPPPAILAQPRNLRVLQGSSGSLTVLVDQPATIKWYKGTNSPVYTGTNGSLYSIPNAQLSDAGDFFCTASNANGMATSQVASVTVSLPQDNYTLSQLWRATPALGSYVTSDGGPNTPNERAFAYNAPSNELVVVRCPPASTAYTVSVVNASSGVFLHLLDTSTVEHQGASEVSGSNPIDLVGAAAADDGAIYVCSESPNASGGAASDTNKMLRLYRWANTAPSTVPVKVFAGDPGGIQTVGINYRWGDVLTARGSGTNTELFLNSFDGTLAAVLKPTDATMNTFTNYWFADVSGGGSIGRSVQFGAGTTVYEKRKGALLVKSSYDLNTSSALTLLSIASSDSLGGVWVDTRHNIMAGVDFIGANSAPDAVALYDITDTGSPMLLGRLNFQPNPNVANANVICTTILAGNRGWSMDANNGILAFNINGPTLSIVQEGNNAIVSWGLFAGYTLQATPSLSPAVTWTNVAPPATIYTVNGKYTVTNTIHGGGLYYRLCN